MEPVLELSLSRWDQPVAAAEQARAISALEDGSVLLMPHLPFLLDAAERQLLSDSVAGDSKNVSLDPKTGLLRGSNAAPATQALMQAMMARFAASTRNLLDQLLPQYRSGLQMARTSFRPLEIAGRTTSWRKDDTRLHVDSFPSSPTQGTRILRVFSNIHPQDHARQWRLGEPFTDVARRFVPGVKPPVPGSAPLLHWLGATKRRRSAYDHYMLRLHDTMKADTAYQRSAPQQALALPPGSSWIVFTDLASHAAMAGQYALEQTWHLPVSQMQDPARSPLRILEGMLGRALA